jgi:hypothetical protein
VYKTVAALGGYWAELKPEMDNFIEELGLANKL